MRLLTLLTAVSVVATCQTELRAAAPVSDGDIARYARRLLDENYRRTGPGAAIIVARDNRILFRGARGLRDVAHGAPIDPGDLFDIASISKQFIAAGILKLVEAGAVSLSDPLSKYLSDYPDGDRITLLELLNHTSGVKSYTDMPELLTKTMTPESLIDGFKSEPTDFAPGAGWAYDNSGYVLLGEVIERVTHKTWYSYVSDSLLQPLGLKNTGFVADPRFAERKVRGYSLDRGKSVAAGPFNLTHPYADGGLVSNIDDLLLWNRALHEGRVLKNASYRRMITPVGAAVTELYGFGIRHGSLRGRTMLGHSGHLAGFSSFLLYLPETRITVAILQNVDPDDSFDDSPITARKLAAFAIGAPFPKPRQIAVPAPRLVEDQGVFGAELRGSRTFSLQGARVLRLIDGALTIARTGDDRKRLIATGSDSFVSSNGLDRIHIDRNSVGEVVGIRFFPDGEGIGQRLARSGGELPPQVELPVASLQRVTGTYAADGLDVQVILDRGKLKATINGQLPPATLIPESPNDFVVAEVDSDVKFSTEAIPKSMILKQGHIVVDLNRSR